MKRFTNPLDNIRVASPCKADWNQMYGNDRKRFCAECKLNVYNLSDMTRDQAEGFLMASDGRVCVRYFRRADGTVMTDNCPKGWERIRKRSATVAGGFLGLLVGLFSGVGFETGFRKLASAESTPVREVELGAPTVSFSGILENLGEIKLAIRGRNE